MAEEEKKLFVKILRSWDESGVRGTREEVQQVLDVLTDSSNFFICFFA